MTRIVLADDHPIVLEGLASLLVIEGFDIVARCRDGDAAIVAIADHDPDIVILDIEMPGVTGLQILRDLRARGAARPRVIILTASLDRSQIAEAVALEANGLVLKELVTERIVECIEHVASGQQWIDNDALKRVIVDLARRDARHAATRPLSARESEVARLAARGLRNRDIAEALGLTESTVKMHMGNVFDKLGVASRAELAALARDLGLG
jgi:two-component system, NarL family, nitrate/nitrite response regulator NarL